MEITIKECDKIRKQVTVESFIIVDEKCDLIAKVKTTRPCYMKTGMEKLTSIIEIFKDKNGNSIYRGAISKAGGCGYDKAMASQLNALKELGFTTTNESGGWIAPDLVIAHGLNLKDWRAFDTN